MRLKHFKLDIGAQILLACSDRSRLRVLNLLLRNGEMSITDLEQVLGFTQSKTSRHLLYLKNSGILNIRKINQWSFYSVKDELSDVINTVIGFVARDPELINDQQAFQTLLSNRELPGIRLRNQYDRRNDA